MNLTACTGKLVRIQWRDIVEDPDAPLDPVAFRKKHARFGLAWTTGVLIAIDDEDVFVATTLGVDPDDASSEGNSVIRIARGVVVKAYLLKHGKELSTK